MFGDIPIHANHPFIGDKPSFAIINLKIETKHLISFIDILSNTTLYCNVYFVANVPYTISNIVSLCFTWV